MASILVLAVAALGLVGLASRPSAAGALSIDARVAASPLAPELSFLTSAQNADGGFGGRVGRAAASCTPPGPRSVSPPPGAIPASVRRSGRSVLDSLRAEASTLQGLGDAERTILAARACGVSAYSFAGRNLVAEVLRSRASDDSFAHQVNLTAFAIFALRAVGHSPRLVRDPPGGRLDRAPAEP